VEEQGSAYEWNYFKLRSITNYPFPQVTYCNQKEIRDPAPEGYQVTILLYKPES
jgi:hypothetical protein